MAEVIDIHSHLLSESTIPAAFWDGLVDMIHREREKQGDPLPKETIREKYLPSFWDRSGEYLLQRMAEANVDRQVVFPVDWGLAIGEPATPIEEFNEEIASFQREHPGKITAFASVDPRRENAASVIDRALDDLGMEGLKLHPTTGFYLHDEETYELLEIARGHDVPVITDTGPIIAPLYSKYSHPTHLDEVLADFPNLPIIAAHMSLEWWDDLLAIAEAKSNTNLHVDISGWQETADDDPDQFATVVRKFVDAIGADRVHFGTDDPLFDPAYPKEQWIEQVGSLADRTTEPTFHTDEVESILSDGARELLPGVD